MADEVIVFCKQLAELVSQKREDSYSVFMEWLRYWLSFALLRCAILCIRGSLITLLEGQYMRMMLLMQWFSVARLLILTSLSVFYLLYRLV